MRKSKRSEQRVAEWTLKWRGGRETKSTRKSCGLDFEAVGRCAKVQKERDTED